MDTSKLELVIGLTGQKAGGKGTFADHAVERYGFHCIATRNVIIAALQARGIDNPTTPQMQDEGNRGRRESGDGGYWQRQMVATAVQNGWSRLVCDGIRNPAEILALREMLGSRFVEVAIVAPLRLRTERFLKRAQVGARVNSVWEFLEIDDRDRGIGTGEPLDGQQVDRTIAMVTPENVYVNNRSLDDYYGWIAYLMTRHLPVVECRGGI
jgi:hypothetical protein